MVERILTKLRSIDVRSLIIAFPFIACLHEFEEWNILTWHQTYNTNMPAGLTHLDLRTIFLIINAVIVVWTVVALSLKNRKATIYVLAPLFVISLTNGFEHLIWQLEFGVYAPGFIFGFFFEAPLILAIGYLSLKEKLIPPWFAAVCVGILAAGIVNVIRLGAEIDPFIVNVMKLSPAVSDFIWR